jgi:predicted nucleic acid-binding protein
MIVVDSSVLSLVYRREWVGLRPSVVEEFEELVRANAALAIPGIVLQEVMAGVRIESKFLALRSALLSFPILPASAEEHVLAAEISTSCGRSGIAASAVDCLIAAQTIACNGRLWTLDRDFAAIARYSRLKFFRPA